VGALLELAERLGSIFSIPTGDRPLHPDPFVALCTLLIGFARVNGIHAFTLLNRFVALRSLPS
jgi:3-methyladenine DNA glycosylase/8-oxoguanine DNA glycosylase